MQMKKEITAYVPMYYIGNYFLLQYYLYYLTQLYNNFSIIKLYDTLMLKFVILNFIILFTWFVILNFITLQYCLIQIFISLQYIAMDVQSIFFIF